MGIIYRKNRETLSIERRVALLWSPKGFGIYCSSPQDKIVRFLLPKCHSSNARFKSHSPDKKQSKYEIWNPHFYVTTDCRHRGMMSHRVTPCIKLFEFGRKMIDLIAVRNRFMDPSLLALSADFFGINLHSIDSIQRWIQVKIWQLETNYCDDITRVLRVHATLENFEI